MNSFEGLLPVSIFGSEAHGLPTILQGKIGSLVGFLCTLG